MAVIHRRIFQLSPIEEGQGELGEDLGVVRPADVEGLVRHDS